MHHLKKVFVKKVRRGGYFMRKISKTICFLLVSFLIIGLFSFSIIAENPIGISFLGANIFNVVFVSDCSGSINNTDPKDYRYQAADLFLSLLTENGGNQVGVVLFNSQILNEGSIMSGSGSMVDKKNHSKSIRQGVDGLGTMQGNTDIGKALKAATDMLDEQRDKNLPSVIVLFTDGNTYGVDIEQSKTYKQAAIDACRENGYKVFGVTLNQNGDADPNEVRDIADSTGGKFTEVKDAASLLKTFEEFYTFIYSTYSIPVAKGTGTILGTFTVPKIGVDEINIVIYSRSAPIRSLRIKQPSGIWLSQSEIDALRINGENFTAVKIVQNLMKGEWELEVVCSEGDYAEVSLVPNRSVKIVSSLERQKDNWRKDDEITIIAQVYSHDDLVIDSDVYQSGIYTGYILLKPANKDEEVKISLTGKADSFTASVKFSDYGLYYITAVISGEMMEYTGETITITVVNTPPVFGDNVDADGIIYRKFVLPLLGVKTDKLSLSEIIKDAEDPILEYYIVESKTDFPNDEYSIIDGILSVTPTNKGVFSVTVSGNDSQGANCEVTIKYTVVSIMPLLLIIIVTLILLILVIIIFTKFKKMFISWEGNITVEPFNKNEYGGFNSRSIPSQNGKYSLFKIIGIKTECQGFESAKFIAKSPGEVYFISAHPFYCDGSERQVKSVRLPNEMEITVSKNTDADYGLKIQYTRNEENYEDI